MVQLSKVTFFSNLDKVHENKNTKLSHSFEMVLKIILKYMKDVHSAHPCNLLPTIAESILLNQFKIPYSLFIKNQ